MISKFVQSRDKVVGKRATEGVIGGAGGEDEAAAEADILVIESDRLSGSRGALRDRKCHRGDAIFDRLDGTGLVGLAVSDFGPAGVGQARGRRRDPGELAGCEGVTVESGMALSLSEDDDIARDLFADDVPGVARAADGQPFALSNRIVGHAVVFSHNVSFRRFKVAWGNRQILT